MSTADARPALRQLRRQLMQLSGQLDRILSELEDAAPRVERGCSGLPRTEAIVHVLRTRATPMTPVEIWQALLDSGSRDEKNLIQVTTYGLWRRGRLVKLDRGVYCHPEHVPDHAVHEPDLQRPHPEGNLGDADALLDLDCPGGPAPAPAAVSAATIAAHRVSALVSASPEPVSAPEPRRRRPGTPETPAGDGEPSSTQGPGGSGVRPADASRA